MKIATETVYVVRDAGGEYISGRGAGMLRTMASNEANEFTTRKQAEDACSRTTDRVLSRQCTAE